MSAWDTLEVNGRWQWVAPDSWPLPPKGWAPYPGWQPDPAWPAPPPDHQFWRRPSRSRLAATLITITGVAAAAIFGSIFVAVVLFGNCAFDPPPGDVASMTLTNDLTRPVTFEACLDSQCARRDSVNSYGPVSPGSGVQWNHELCGEEWVGVVDGSGHLIGCVTLPAADPPKVTHFNASSSAPCH